METDVVDLSCQFNYYKLYICYYGNHCKLQDDSNYKRARQRIIMY